MLFYICLQNVVDIPTTFICVYISVPCPIVYIGIMMRGKRISLYSFFLDLYLFVF